MATYTETATYTRTDVAKVFESFEADLCLIARTTGLYEEGHARTIAHDLRMCASHAYLKKAHIMLIGSNGQTKRVHEYEVSTDASSWDAQRPAGNIWQSQPGDQLQVVMCWNEAWACLQSDRQEQFRKQLKLQWSASKIDTSHPGLVTVTTRTYTSNAYGLKRETRERP